jgi:hypothetical protein
METQTQAISGCRVIARKSPVTFELIVRQLTGKGCDRAIPRSLTTQKIMV